MEKISHSTSYKIKIRDSLLVVFISVALVIMFAISTGAEKMCLNSPHNRVYVVSHESSTCFEFTEEGRQQVNPVKDGIITVILRSLGFTRE